jgi:ribonuclease J
VHVKEVPVGGSLTLGPFQLDFISITHSILEPNLLAIRTPLGPALPALRPASSAAPAS